VFTCTKVWVKTMLQFEKVCAGVCVCWLKQVKLEHLELIFALLLLLDTLSVQTFGDTSLANGEMSAKLLLVIGDGTHLRLTHTVLDWQQSALQLRGQLALFGRRIALLRLVLVAWEQDQTAAVALQTLHVQLEGFDRSVFATMINRDSDGCDYDRVRRKKGEKRSD
jgi:hypothetical protein